jgi:hypothetical protein
MGAIGLGSPGPGVIGEAEEEPKAGPVSSSSARRLR